MRSSSKLAGFGVAVGAATAVAALLLGSTAAIADEGARPETAYALATSGLIAVGPLTKVASPSGARVYDELAGLQSVPGTQAAGIEAGLLSAEVRAGSATTSVAHVKLAQLLAADLVRTTCEQGEGRLEIVGGSVLGHELPRFPISGKRLDLSPIATVTLGQQTRNPDGSTTVTGIVLRLLPLSPAQLDDPVTAADRATLPLIGGLLGRDLSGAATLGDVVDKIGVSVAGAVQSVTVGSATCAPTAAPDGHHDDGDHPAGDVDHGDTGYDKGGYDKGGYDKDEPVEAPAAADDDGDHDVDEVPEAPAPDADLPEVSLPVTG